MSWTSHNRPSQRRATRLRWLGAILVATSLVPQRQAAPDETSESRVSAPVKLLASPNRRPTPEQPNRMEEEADRPTLPNGKLPQYRLDRPVSKTSATTRPGGKVRFDLGLASRRLSVEAQITIDGAPFRDVRQQRIADILRQAQTPQVENTKSDDPASDKDPVAASPDQPNEKEEESQEEEGDEGDGESDRPPGFQPVTSPTDYVRRYIAATGNVPTVDEVAWLLDQRMDGPTLLPLMDNFQHFRAHQRPAFHVLDRNRDGIIDGAEQKAAAASFNECDLNRDEIVDFEEVSRATVDPRRQPPQPTAQGLIDWSANRSSTPDIILSVAFNSKDGSQSTIAIEHLNPATQGDLTIAAEGAEITLHWAGETVRFSAVQTTASDQISIGAVRDGYPVLPNLDPNDDGRLTIRELRQLQTRLQPLDRDGDGSITLSETPSALRVCIGLGPIVHRELAGIRAASDPSQKPAIVGPEWFVRMDRNKDNDLTRREFPGTDEQFEALDADADALVSAAEALAFDKQNENSSK